MIIGVSGKIGAGKDAIAAHLVKQHGFQIVRFSDALKEEVLRIMPKTCTEIWKMYALNDQIRHVASSPLVPLEKILDLVFGEPTEEDLRHMLWVTKPPIIRRLLQEWGTELRRNEDPNYWIWKWNERVRLTTGVSVVVPDTRFLNEAAAVHLLGGVVLRVERPGLPIGDHPSETDSDSMIFDHVIQNDGTLDDLALHVDAYLASR
jgi:hypothetical protein